MLDTGELGTMLVLDKQTQLFTCYFSMLVKFYSCVRYIMTLTTMHSDWMSIASSSLAIHSYVNPFPCILGNNLCTVATARIPSRCCMNTSNHTYM